MHLLRPKGQQVSSPSMITRRRFKAFFPVLVALLLIPFFFSAFYRGSDLEGDLLSKARQLYQNEDASRNNPQAKLNPDLEDWEGGPIREGNAQTPDANGHEDVIKTSYGYGPPEDEHFLDLDYGKGPESHDLDYDVPDTGDIDMDSGYGGSHPPPSKSLLDLMDFPEEDEVITTIPDRGDYRELFSLTTRDRRYIPLFIEGAGVHGPSVIPHPTKFDMWVVLGQRVQDPMQPTRFEQIVCTAGFLNGVLICAEPFENMTMATLVQGSCQGDLAIYNDYIGGREARMFYGPRAPFVMYNSKSQYTCSSMWMQDVRTLLEPYHLEKPLAKIFTHPTEVQRPRPLNALETDFFVFWDANNMAYAHYQLWPKRQFAQLDFDGSVGDDLAPLAEKKDQVCMAKYMPTIKMDDHQSVQQATNSLAITLCERLDPKCKPKESNTFLMHIFHHAFSYDSHTVYEPFVMLFEQTAPFALHAISQRALWIHGRMALTNETQSPQYPDPEDIPAGHTERYAITSLSWKNHVQRYHGYIDDIVMLGVSIEDARGGMMDIKAKDLVEDLAFC